VELDGKVVVVTGGARGIGRALARRFADEGAKVAVADLDAVGVQAVAEELSAVAPEVIGVPGDVSVEADVQALVVRATEALGPIDLFCSNAGIAEAGGPEASDEAWARSWGVNVMAHVYAARAVLPAMLERGDGYLLQTCSAAGLLSNIGAAPYTATKHAAVGFAEALAIAHGDDGIQVCLVCPQAVATRMIGFDDDGCKPDGASGFGGNDVDGILSADYVADCIVAAIQEPRFLVLPHPQVATYFRRKADDHDRWIGGMQRFRRRLQGLDH
jgi:NAD(P)-dependent dehydrogenase (short-subunit alcohol dehydrogenase family)